MAVTLTLAELSAALRLGATTEETAEATRLLAFVTVAIAKYLGDSYATTPPEVVNEAAIRWAGYLFDQPTSQSGMGAANALRNSGAGPMLLPYRVHTGGLGELAAAQQAVGTNANPVVDVQVVGTNIVVTFEDGKTVTTALPGATPAGGFNPVLAGSSGTITFTSSVNRKWSDTGVAIPAGAFFMVELEIQDGQPGSPQLVNRAHLLARTVSRAAARRETNQEYRLHDVFDLPFSIGHSADGNIMLSAVLDLNASWPVGLNAYTL